MGLNRVVSCSLLLAAALQLSACGGSSGSSSGGSSSPTGSTPAPTSSSANPCSAALAASGGLAATSSATTTPFSKAGRLGYDVRSPHEFLALHQLARRELVRAEDGEPAAALVAPRSGDIVVLNDNGALVMGANGFDLGGAGVRFEPNAEGGYDVVAASPGFRPELGRKLPLGDDATTEEALGFAFSFYGSARASAFVNSDGSLTFTRGDVATDDRSLGRVLSGPPRAALFFADLDPSKGGGVFLSSTASALTVTWCGVPDFDSSGKVTAQATLLPGGSVEMRFDQATTLRDAVVALSPGSTTSFSALDLSASASPGRGGAGAVGERFSTERALDLAGAAQAFYSAYGDDYDQLVFWTDTRVTDSGTFAYETTVSNAIRGIGQDRADLAAQYGSAGRLASVMLMDTLGKYPSDPNARANGEDSALAVVAHESGHRWGATLRFRDAGATSDAWLGRQLAHWSFFTDSDASVLEGNEIQEVGDGSFRTGTPSLRYSPFDLYAMGVLREGEVPATFFVESPVVTDPTMISVNRESAPRSGVGMTGKRHEVTIADVVAAMGARSPAAGSGPFAHRQAWIYVTSAGKSADPAALAKLESYRSAFEGFFASATGGRMTVETRLQ